MIYTIDKIHNNSMAFTFDSKGSIKDNKSVLCWDEMEDTYGNLSV